MKEAFKESYLVFPTYLIFIVQKYNLTLDEMLLLMYFWNHSKDSFNVNSIKEILKLPEESILSSFQTLVSKKLIQIEMLKNEEGKTVEMVNLDGLYQELNEIYTNKERKNDEIDLFDVFEQELSRSITPMEYEIINSWLDKGFSKELILGALKEAVFSGTGNLRYIDKILFEWQKKGYRTVEDALKDKQNRYQQKKEQEPEELFDYNWLEDNEER